MQRKIAPQFARGYPVKGQVTITQVTLLQPTARTNKVHAIAPCQQQVRHGQGGNDMPCTATAGHRYGFGLVHQDSSGSVAALILMIFKTVVYGLHSQVSNPEQILIAALLTGAYAATSLHRGALNPPATD